MDEDRIDDDDVVLTIVNVLNSFPETLYVYGLACLQPPLTNYDQQGGIILEKGLGVNGSYPFGYNVTYICPLGTVFNGTNSRYLVALCYGSVGWYRPINLTCLGPRK